ncbi:Glucans biosynthesis glucosyltransferase H protein [Salinisphaera shabanensis E1L3A]|uniref:Glucans biosynthesis glucosyltransferase H n=1 Tax=Salinisphaera shabanensis E1L3A TaxID=1033802 RepID=U2FWX5_9GAMM|nr:glucans biosynthesis glucosyltransferase MdoH [Salinisphaera shabanensis]ERJ18738.1 Glucans biosynthesis glucosyltransferase H protein [Salinisphaera shabanensis E1L3A]
MSDSNTVVEIIDAIDAYLSHLGLADDKRRRLRARVLDAEPADRRAALDLLHNELESAHVEPELEADDRKLMGRLHDSYPKLRHERETRPPTAGALRSAAMPPLNRWPMSPADIDRRPWRLLPWMGRSNHGLSKSVPSRLKSVVRWRQTLLALMVAFPAAGAAAYMATVLPHRGATVLETFILAAAFMLFAWILVGFWTALSGFFVLWRGDRYLVCSDPPSGPPPRKPPVDGDARTAIVMPIYEEDVTRTFAGLRAIYESVQATGRLEEFDFFVLSDSVKPDTVIAEENAWAESCRTLDAFGRLFYRRRRARVKRKSGNLADFCRRWGGHYRYMIVLDADSIMAGNTLTALVDRMQANPGAGLIQTPPTAVNRDSVLARVQQFATRVYGRMFAAGLHFWHLDNAHYWGHNAIIRIEPFMAHCALPRLPGSGALSGDILSHDFVEAALMRRAGWGVFIAYDLPGSYEEVPPTLLDELGRDRRWCQGNIQHIRLLFSDNLAPAHRALFANGVMAYTSAAIWFVFLLLSSIEAVMEALRTPDYFPVAGALFPAWPVWQPIWALSLFVATLVVLFLPKILGVVMIIAKGKQREFGGVGNLVASTLIEIVLTSLLAPIRMLAHTRFVFTTLSGKQVKWNSQQRADAQVPWSRALRFHIWGMLLALGWGAVLLWYTPGFAPWLAPILVPLIIAPAITVLTSRADLGIWLRRHDLQLIPEERHAPAELARVVELEAGAPAEAGFAEAVVDPVINALHIGMQGHDRSLTAAITEYRQLLSERALDNGPDALDADEQRRLLADPQRMRWLHTEVWAQAPSAWRAWLAERPAAASTQDSPRAV